MEPKPVLAWLNPHRKVVNIQITYLKITGLWCPDSSASDVINTLYNVYKVIIATIMFVFMATVFADVCENFDDLSVVTDGGCIFAGIFVVFYKMMTFLFLYREIAQAVHDTFDCGNSLLLSTSENYEDIIKSYALWDKASLYSFSAIGLALSVALIFLVPTEPGELPIRARYPFDTTNSPWYELAFLVQATAVFAGILAIIGMDSLLLTLCNILVLQLELLTRNFENCGRTSQSRHDIGPTPIQSGDGQFVNHFKTCIRFHQRLIEIVNKLNDNFSASMFVQVLSSSSIICLTGFQTVVIIGDSTTTLKFSIYLGAALAQLLFLCWIGNELLYQSASIITGQWLSNWHVESPRTISHLLIISTMFSRTSLRLRAGKFLTLSLEAFITILRGSYSFFALLSNVHAMDERPAAIADPSTSAVINNEFVETKEFHENPLLSSKF